VASRLTNSTSAYLRAASHHPVDWRPWGVEAFEEARDRGLPVLLGIGASWCHYCHVMDEECYQNSEVARLIEERYVPVRLDRDAHPEIDARYQAAVHQITGLSGWPLTAFLTPDGDVFYGGTSFSLRPSGSRPGFIQILTWASELYKSGPAKRVDEGRRLRASLVAGSRSAAPHVEIRDALDAYHGSLVDSADRRNGGFGEVAKFPFPHALGFLLDRSRASSEPFAREFVRFTLQRMLEGGLFDRVGGGFHRYTIDDRFESPHFEKLLAPNADLLALYAQGAVDFEQAEFRRAAEATARWMLDSMQLPDGGFAASQDAGGAGDVGNYYVWTRDEVAAAVGPMLAPFADYIFQLDAVGNIAEKPGSHVLCMRVPLENAGRTFGIDTATATRHYESVIAALAAARQARSAPRIDFGFEPAWNAVAAAALTRAGSLLGHPDWTDAAERVARRLVAGVGSRGLVERPDRAPLLQDSAAAAQAFVLLGECGRGSHWFDSAASLLKSIFREFADDSPGGLRDIPTRNAARIEGEWRREPWDDSMHASGNALVLSATTGVLTHRPDAVLGEACERLAMTATARLRQLEPTECAAAAVALQRWFTLEKRGKS
jgi:hypothetical protein